MTSAPLPCFQDSPSFHEGREARIVLLYPEGPISPEQEAALQRLLSDDEARRVADFKSGVAGDQFLWGRALLRRALSACLGLEPRDVPLELGEFGKPFLPPDVASGLEFSLAHKPGCIAVAFARGAHIGVDIEAIETDRANRQIARRYFALKEVAQLAGIDGHDLAHRFYRFWTLKEAYIKARGLGLRLPLQDFFFSFDDPDTLELSGPGIQIGFSPRIDDRPTDWQFDIRYIEDEHLLALAIRRGEGSDLDLRFDTIPGDQLLRG
jgi:4'-phosphopantetheinyl transferase